MVKIKKIREVKQKIKIVRELTDEEKAAVEGNKVLAGEEHFDGIILMLIYWKRAFEVRWNISHRHAHICRCKRQQKLIFLYKKFSVTHIFLAFWTDD